MSRPQRLAMRACMALVLVSFAAGPAFARVVDDVKIRPVPTGYEIRTVFLTALQYQTTVPTKPAKEFYIQMKTINIGSLDAATVDSLRERVSLPWDSNSDAPLHELIFDGSDPEHPQIYLSFTREVELEVQSSADLLSLLMRVKTPRAEKPAVGPVVVEDISGKTSMKDEKLSALMEEAKSAMDSADHPRAVQLYTKVLETAKDDDRKKAQELLGMARERSNQLAHAVAEYKKFLQEFPSGPDADRVRQRLAGLVTAAEAPKQVLKEGRRAGKAAAQPVTVQNYGNFSQFYFRDQSIPQGSEVRVNRSDLTSNLDLNSRLRGPVVDASARFTGGDVRSFITAQPDYETLSALYADVKWKQTGLYAKVGRQSLTSGGVLGRFDGIHLASQINPTIKVNGVFGSPVESTKQTSIQTEKKFYDINVDFIKLWKGWDFNAFFIDQENSGFLDRRAVGGEARYFDAQKALFTLVDYDLFFKTLNIFLMNGHWTLPSKTTFNMVLDYRKTPLMTTNNAIIGQGTSHLSDLSDRFSRSEIKRLAEDRTTNIKQATFGVTQDIKDDLQATMEFSATQTEGTISSEGVEGSEAVRPDYAGSLELVASNVFMDNDTFIAGLSLTDKVNDDTYTVSLNSRFPISKNLRVNPRMRFDYRDAKSGTDNQVTLRPSLRVEYGVTQDIHFEVEGGLEWIDEKAAGIARKSTESFVTAGFRITF